MKEKKNYYVGGYVLLVVAFIFPLSVYLGVIFLAPSDILNQSPMLRGFSMGVRDLLMTNLGGVDIHRQAQITSFPQIAMLASSLAVCIVGFTSMCIAVQGWVFYENAIDHMGRDQMQSDLLLRMTGMPIFFAALYWSFFCLQIDYSLAQGLTTKSRLGYAFISSVAVFGVAIGLGSQPMNLRFFLTRN